MPKKILVVEDDEELVQLLVFNLTQAGFEVDSATNGSDGLKKSRTIHPDLILLDLMLPELDGYAICEILRRDSTTANIPVIIVTAVAGALARISGFDAGATDFVTKPFSPKELIARIQGILEVAAETAARRRSIAY